MSWSRSSGKTGQRQCLGHEGSGNTGQRQCLTSSVPAPISLNALLRLGNKKNHIRLHNDDEQQWQHVSHRATMATRVSHVRPVHRREEDLLLRLVVLVLLARPPCNQRDDPCRQIRQGCIISLVPRKVIRNNSRVTFLTHQHTSSHKNNPGLQWTRGPGGERTSSSATASALPEASSDSLLIPATACATISQTVVQLSPGKFRRWLE